MFHSCTLTFCRFFAMGPLQPRRAYDLGDLVFKAQACEIWGLSPDLFADPEASSDQVC